MCSVRMCREGVQLIAVLQAALCHLKEWSSSLMLCLAEKMVLEGGSGGSKEVEMADAHFIMTLMTGNV